MNALQIILANKRREVERQKQALPASVFEKQKFFQRSCLSLSASLCAKQPGIIAEFKRKSPSKGIINQEASIDEVLAGYSAAGAAGVSILTDSRFFSGSPADLVRGRNLLSLPILRKDFIIDEYQVLESKALGADVVLLIGAALEKKQASQLSSLARRLGLEVLFEVHKAEDLDKMPADVFLVGVNNRDLENGRVDIRTSVALAPKLPLEMTRISESGINAVETVLSLQALGYRGFLIGELLMSGSPPGEACRELISGCLNTAVL